MVRQRLDQERAALQPGDIRHLDLHLIRVLRTLLIEGSVSRAARKLNQSQPQISAALARLRRLTGDQLLIRSRRGMTPTEYGQSLIEPATRVLEDVQALFTNRTPFEPARSSRNFAIAVPDYLGAPLLAALFAEIRSAAPTIRIAIKPITSDAQAAEMLEAGDADLVIESNIIRSGHIRFAELFDDTVVSIARATVIERRRLTLKAYLQLPHIAAAPSSGTRPGFVDRFLATKKLRRNVQAWVPYLNTLPEILSTTDLVFTTTKHLAAHLVTTGRDLVMFSPPIAFPKVRYYQLWHNRAHASEDQRWLLAVVESVVRRQVAMLQGRNVE
jgi:DNA-binding transcriptional LysR family regulator